MKYIAILLIFLLGSCEFLSTTFSNEEKTENPPKYKKGDIVCVIEFNVKGIIQYRSIVLGSGENIYSVMFNDKNDQLYNLSIYESQLTECH